MATTGGCLCGQVRYKAKGEPLAVVTCHCRWCQRLSGGPFLTFVGFLPENLVWTEGEPAIFKSSAAVDRGFCHHCGSTLSFARPAHNVISIMAGSLDDPNSISPEMHCYAEQQCRWLHLDDGLPSYERFPPEWEDREAT